LLFVDFCSQPQNCEHWNSSGVLSTKESTEYDIASDIPATGFPHARFFHIFWNNPLLNRKFPFINNCLPSINITLNILKILSKEREWLNSLDETFDQSSKKQKSFRIDWLPMRRE